MKEIKPQLPNEVDAAIKIFEDTKGYVQESWDRISTLVQHLREHESRTKEMLEKSHVTRSSQPWSL